MAGTEGSSQLEVKQMPGDELISGAIWKFVDEFGGNIMRPNPGPEHE